MNEILEEFREESKNLTNELEKLLEDIENDFDQKQRLNEFAQIIDRIMGSAHSLNSFGFDQDAIKKIGDFAELCKQIGYRSANVKDKDLYDITIAFLFDSIESIKKLLNIIGEEKNSKNISDFFVSTFINRLKWILEQLHAKNIEMTNYTGATSNKIKTPKELASLVDSISSKD